MDDVCAGGGQKAALDTLYLVYGVTGYYELPCVGAVVLEPELLEERKVTKLLNQF